VSFLGESLEPPRGPRQVPWAVVGIGGGTGPKVTAGPSCALREPLEPRASALGAPTPGAPAPKPRSRSPFVGVRSASPAPAFSATARTSFGAARSVKSERDTRYSECERTEPKADDSLSDRGNPGEYLAIISYVRI
jgi:hypothetical protein